MNTQEVFRLIRQNGIGQNVRCFFISEDFEKNKDHMSLVNHYKHRNKNNVIKIHMDRFHLQEHQKNLIKFPNCELLIKEDKNGQATTIRLFCKFIEIEDSFVFVRAFKIKYLNPEKKEINQMVYNFDE
jgi:hypothetical protein